MVRKLLMFICVFGLFVVESANCFCQSDIQYNVTSTFDSYNKILFNQACITFSLDSVATDSLIFWRMMADNGAVFLLDSIIVNKKRLKTKITGEDMCIPEGNDFDTNSEDEIDSLMIFVLPTKSLLNLKENKIEFYYRIDTKGAVDQKDSPMSEGYGFADYFPRLVRRDAKTGLIKNRYSYFEKFSIDVKLPSDLFFMAEKSGRITQIGDSLFEYRIDTLTTILPYWLAFPISYHSNRNLGPIEADIYCDPSINIDNDQLKEMGEALSYYESCFGKLPFEKINVLFVGIPKNTGGLTIGNFIFLSNGKDSLSLIEKVLPYEKMMSVVPHEVAHLWWGSSVGIVKDKWLAEGLACYWANKFEVIRKGRQPFEKGENKARRILYRLLGKTKTKQGVEVINLYYKAPYLLSMIELQMSFPNFTRACKEFYQRYKNKCTSFNEFKEIVQKYSAAPLDSFLASWTDSNFSQNYSIAEVKSKKNGSRYDNLLRLTKAGKASSPVPVLIKYEDGSKDEIIFNPEKLYLKWYSSSEVLSVSIDPSRLILESDRSDNVWPVPIRFKRFHLNIADNMKLFLDFFSDDPGYKLYLFPDAIYSERFGWDFSINLLGSCSPAYEEYFADAINKLKVAYNERNNDLEANLFLTKTVFKNARKRMMLNAFMSSMHGVRDAGVGFAFDYFMNTTFSMKYPVARMSANISHEKYYSLDNVSEAIWPAWESTLVKLRIQWLHYLMASLEAEKGLRVTSVDKSYFRSSVCIEKEINFFYGRLFYGITGGDALQNRFDPAYEGGILGISSFKYLYDKLIGLNLRINIPLRSPFRLRVFGNYVNPMNDDKSSISECGLGLALGRYYGIRIDMPVYLSGTYIDESGWSWKRFRIRLYFLNFSSPQSARLDFLIR